MFWYLKFDMITIAGFLIRWLSWSFHTLFSKWFDRRWENQTDEGAGRVPSQRSTQPVLHLQKFTVRLSEEFKFHQPR